MRVSKGVYYKLGNGANAIDDGNKKARISSNEFELELANMLALHGLII